MHSRPTRAGHRMHRVLVALAAVLALLATGLVASPASASESSAVSAKPKKAKKVKVKVGAVKIVDVTSETNLVTVASAVKVRSSKNVKKVKIEYKDTTSGAVKTVQGTLDKGTRKHGTFRGRISFGAGQVRALRAAKVRVIGYHGKRLKTVSLPVATAPVIGVYVCSFSYAVTGSASGPASDRVVRTSVEYSGDYNGMLRFHPTLRNDTDDVVSHSDVQFSHGLGARGFDAAPGRRLAAFRLTSTGTDTGGLFWQF